MWEAKRAKLIRNIFNPLNRADFEDLALELFRFQSELNPLYRAYIQLLGIPPESVQKTSEIPFLPIELFKSHQVVTGSFSPQATFSSSQTTGGKPSLHCVRDLQVYEKSFHLNFEKCYGRPNHWCIYALLPSYQERSGSSLIYMTEYLIKKTGNRASGFFLNNPEKLYDSLVANEAGQVPTLLIGVTFALLDFAEKYAIPLQSTIIMETGGMKGRREELTREEVHDLLKRAFDVRSIHSEYGMTELLSQAYSRGNGVFQPPPWMSVLTRDPTDPLNTFYGKGEGGLNIIDLANIDSCAFLATSDLGRVFEDGSFTVSGRFDQAEARGCNLMVS